MDVVCNPFANVAANSKATAKWSNLLGYTLDRVVLTLGGAVMTKALMTKIRVLANGKVIFDDSGSNVDSRMQYRGITANANDLSIDFSEIRARTVTGQHVGSIDTVSSGIRDLTCEIDIGAATTPTLTAQAQVSGAPQADKTYAGLISKVMSFTANYGAAGEFPIDIPYGRQAGTLIKRIHFFGATVTGARLKKNGIEIFNRTVALNDFIQTELQRVPQANIFTADFIEDGNLSNALNAANANTMEYFVTVNGAGNVQAVCELLDPLGNN